MYDLIIFYNMILALVEYYHRVFQTNLYTNQHRNMITRSKKKIEKKIVLKFNIQFFEDDQHEPALVDVDIVP